MQQALNKRIFCAAVTCTRGWPGSSAAGAALIPHLPSGNSASRWLPLSFIPDAFTFYSWFSAINHIVSFVFWMRNARQYPPFIVFNRVQEPPYFVCRMLFSYFTTVAVIEAQIGNFNTLFSSHSALARFWKKMHKAFYSSSQICIQSNSFCSILSNLIAGKLS